MIRYFIRAMNRMRHRYLQVIALGAAVGASASQPAMPAAAPAQASQTANAPGPAAGENPFFAESTLPYHAPPFDRIKDTDYQPAIEAGMAEQLKEIDAIAADPSAPTFGNTIVALEKTGQLFDRALAAFSGVTGANTNPTLEKAQAALAPKMAAHRDAIYLNEKLFARVKTLHEQMDHLDLQPQDKRVLDLYYKRFVHQGANLSPENKTRLKQLNEQESTLSNTFRQRLLAGTRAGAFFTTDKAALKGMSGAQIAAAATAAKARKQEGFLIPLQNTTQQPALASLADRTTRQAIFENSWNRNERGGDSDTRETVLALVKLRAEKGKLLGFPTYAAWKTEDQMAK